jgi:hypothetical protein
MALSRELDEHAAVDYCSRRLIDVDVTVTSEDGKVARFTVECELTPGDCKRKAE